MAPRKSIRILFGFAALLVPLVLFGKAFRTRSLVVFLSTEFDTSQYDNLVYPNKSELFARPVFVAPRASFDRFLITAFSGTLVSTKKGVASISSSELSLGSRILALEALQPPNSAVVALTLSGKVIAVSYDHMELLWAVCFLEGCEESPLMSSYEFVIDLHKKDWIIVLGSRLLNNHQTEVVGIALHIDGRVQWRSRSAVNLGRVENLASLGLTFAQLHSPPISSRISLGDGSMGVVVMGSQGVVIVDEPTGRVLISADIIHSNTPIHNGGAFWFYNELNQSYDSFHIQEYGESTQIGFQQCLGNFQNLELQFPLCDARWEGEERRNIQFSSPILHKNVVTVWSSDGELHSYSLSRISLIRSETTAVWQPLVNAANKRQASEKINDGEENIASFMSFAFQPALLFLNLSTPYLLAFGWKDVALVGYLGSEEAFLSLSCGPMQEPTLHFVDNDEAFAVFQCPDSAHVIQITWRYRWLSWAGLALLMAAVMAALVPQALHLRSMLFDRPRRARDIPSVFDNIGRPKPRRRLTIGKNSEE